MNIITATFPPGCTQITAAAEVWQWDQGQILAINGIDLPDAFQVEFSNYAVRGQAAPMIGGPDGVEIPDVYLTTGLPVFAFIVLHTGEDDRETEYRITIPVIARPQPTDVEPTPEQKGVIDQLIAALDAGVDRAEDAADAAEAALEEFTTPTATAETLPAGSSATASYENGNFNFGIPRGDTGADGAPGPTGATPDFSIGTVSTLPAESDATASITGTAEEPVLNLGIPKGDKGNTGAAGADGVSPEVTIASITGGHSVTITDADHPTGQTFNVMDGESGEGIAVAVSGTTPSITAEANHRYICGTLDELTFTPPASGVVDVVFTSGTTPTVLNLPNTVKMPEWFEVEAGYTYEINIADGVYGAVIAWATA